MQDNKRFGYDDMSFMQFTDGNGNPVNVAPTAFPGQPGAPAKTNPAPDHVDDLHRLAMAPDATPTIQGLAIHAQMQRKGRGR